MRCVVLAAGRGTRMGALTQTTPKPMLPLLWRPMLEWKLEMLPPGIDEVCMVIGYLGDQIEAYFGSVWQGRNIRYVRQDRLDGSGGAVHCADAFVSGPTLVLMGDDLYHPSDLKEMTHVPLAVLGKETDHAEAFGLLERDEQGYLQRITERPHGRVVGMVNTGAYILDERFFDYPLIEISETEYGLPQTLVTMSRDVPIAVLAARAWQPVGCPEDIALGEAFLKQYHL